MLGTVAQATSTIPLMTYVTCPTTRDHPAVVAQKATTLQPVFRGGPSGRRPVEGAGAVAVRRALVSPTRSRGVSLE